MNYLARDLAVTAAMIMPSLAASEAASIQLRHEAVTFASMPRNGEERSPYTRPFFCRTGEVLVVWLPPTSSEVQPTSETFDPNLKDSRTKPGKKSRLDVQNEADTLKVELGVFSEKNRKGRKVVGIDPGKNIWVAQCTEKTDPTGIIEVYRNDSVWPGIKVESPVDVDNQLAIANTTAQASNPNDSQPNCEYLSDPSVTNIRCIDGYLLITAIQAEMIKRGLISENPYNRDGILGAITLQKLLPSLGIDSTPESPENFINLLTQNGYPVSFGKSLPTPPKDQSQMGGNMPTSVPSINTNCLKYKTNSGKEDPSCSPLSAANDPKLNRDKYWARTKDPKNILKYCPEAQIADQTDNGTRFYLLDGATCNSSVTPELQATIPSTTTTAKKALVPVTEVTLTPNTTTPASVTTAKHPTIIIPLGGISGAEEAEEDTTP